MTLHPLHWNNPGMTISEVKTSKISWKILLLILSLAVVLLVAAAVQKSFWEDEAFTANAVQGSYTDLMKIAQRDVHPPLYLVSLMIWSRVFGTTELPLRSFSILFSVAALFLTFFICQELFGNRVATIALALTAFSPVFIMYGQNARYYSMATALSLLAIFSMLRLQGSSRWYYWIVYIFAGVSLLYLLFAAGTVLVACNLWWLRKRLRRKQQGANYIGWFPWLLAQVGILLLYLPGLKLMFSVAGRYASQPLAVAGLLGDVLKRVGLLGYAFSVGETFSPLNPAAWVGLAVVIVTVFVALIHWRRDENVLLPVLFLVAIGSVNVLISLIPLVAQTWQNLPYRMFYAFPFFTILLAAGLSNVRPLIGTILGGLLLGVYILGLFNYYTDRQFIRPIYTIPWREVFAHIQAEEDPGAVVICDGDAACTYYATRYLHTAYKPGNWRNLSKLTPTDVWWVESNEGAQQNNEGVKMTALQDIRQHYQQASVIYYAPQDKSIRWIKATFLKQEDYEYRLTVYRFFYSP
jgi:hypothetical protein